MDNSDIILKVENLSVYFNNETILNNLSFNLKEKEALAILGPNGAGKTTLLKALIGAVPYQGQIIWLNNIKIGYVPQKTSLLQDIPISVEEFFNLQTKNKEGILKILFEIGLSDSILQKKLKDLSSGQLQRSLIGWSIIANPDVLLFDEPLSGIDIGGQQTVYHLLSQLKKERGLSLIFVTHELSIVSSLADNVLCLNKQMLCFASPKEILNPEILNKIYGQEIKFYTHNH